jgi:hypothetical protein
VAFDSTLMKAFGRAPRPKFLECPKYPQCVDICFPIYSKGVDLISYEVITSIAYFGNWALLALVVVSKS